MNLIELLVAIFVMTTVLTVAVASYTAGNKAWQKGVEINEITQNSRLAIDKIARELRQTDEITTNFPAEEIEFQDGHSENLQYARYYLDNNAIHRQIIIYYLDSMPVRYDTQGAEPLIEQDQIIAEKISNMQFSGGKLIQIQVNDFITKTVGRNIK